MLQKVPGSPGPSWMAMHHALGLGLVVRRFFGPAEADP